MAEKYALVQPFQQLARDRLTALAVFFRTINVPAGAVLATQGSPVDKLFLIMEGEVSFMLEGGSGTNPMDPNSGSARHSQSIRRISHLSAGSAPGMKAAMHKQHSSRDYLQGDVPSNRCAANGIF